MHDRGKWKDSPEGLSVYYYEGDDLDEYSIPYPHVFVMVVKIGVERGFSIAYKWDTANGENIRRIWMNILQGTWEGWKLIVDI